MCAPTRFDLSSSSCVNKEVASFNRKLQKVMKPYAHVQVCSMSTNRDHFTSHGMLMSARGKHWISNTWASFIKTLGSSSSSTSIIPLPERMKCIVNLASQNNNSFGNDLSMGTAQDKVMDSHEVYPNAAFTNEPAKRKLRASHSKKPLDKNEDSLWY